MVNINLEITWKEFGQRGMKPLMRSLNEIEEEKNLIENYIIPAVKTYQKDLAKKINAIMPKRRQKKRG